MPKYDFFAPGCSSGERESSTVPYDVRDETRTDNMYKYRAMRLYIYIAYLYLYIYIAAQEAGSYISITVYI